MSVMRPVNLVVRGCELEAQTTFTYRDLRYVEARSYLGIVVIIKNVRIREEPSLRNIAEDRGRQERTLFPFDCTVIK
jgi:hypothetical protein